MKIILASMIFMSALATQAATIKSTKATAKIARIVQVIPLVQKDGLQVSVAVEDLGGSTDVSSTQTAYLTLYAKGEMFSSDATFKITDMLQLISAKRVSGGVYEIKAVTIGLPDYSVAERTITIDARKAVTDIQAVDCGGDFDCAASTDFASTVEVTTK